MAKDGKN
jgi:hypothetical protein